MQAQFDNVHLICLADDLVHNRLSSEQLEAAIRRLGPQERVQLFDRLETLRRAPTVEEELRMWSRRT